MPAKIETDEECPSVGGSRDDTDENSHNSNQQQRFLKAIVIGAGPAGLATALGLSHVCQSVVVIEKHATFSQQGSTFGIAANGKRALQELHPDLWEHLEQVGIPLPGSGGLLLPWWEMRDALLHVVQRDDNNIKLLTGEDFIEIVDQPDKDDTAAAVTVRFRSGLVVTGDFLVGADGVHSAVRAWLDLPAAQSTASRVFRGSLTVNADSSDQLRALLQHGLVPRGAEQYEGVYFIVFNFHSKHAGRLAWALSTTRSVDQDDTDDATATTPFSIMSQVVTDTNELELLREIFELSDPDHLKPYPPTKVIDFSDQALEPLSSGWGGRGRVVLVGDAAHAMRPTDGQGGNQAFEDAVVLSRSLASCSADDPSSSIQQALRTFEASRLPRVKRIHDDHRIRYENRMKGESVGPMSTEFREWIEKGQFTLQGDIKVDGSTILTN